MSSCLVFTTSDQPDLSTTTASLALQAALTAASNGERVVMVSASQWLELPPSCHLMPGLSSELMKLIKLIYPTNSKVSTVQTSLSSLPQDS